MKRLSISILSVVLLLTFVMSSTYAADPPLVRYLVKIEGPPGNVEKAVNAFGGKVTHIYSVLPEWIAVEIPEAALPGLERNPRVIDIEVDATVYAIDTELDNSWGVKRIGAGTVHDGGNKGTGVPVAIIDTGIDYTHPDLDDSYVIGGYDFVNKDNDPMDDNGHGTHVAGTVAAEDNDIGVIGVSPGASLYALKVLGADGSGSYSDIAAAIDWCVTNGIAVANMSIGGTFNSSALETACNNAYEAGVLLVAAAGNSGTPPGRGDNIEYPARYSSVIAVAATDNSDKRARWSSTGSDLELAAPGVDITSTYLDGGYAIGSGTSMACPHVAGTAALVIASGITGSAAVRAQLQNTAEDLGDPGWDTKYGYGLVDADEAAGTPPSSITDIAITAVDAPSSVVKGDVVDVNVTVKNVGNQNVSSDISVTLTDETDGVTIGTQTISDGLAAGASKTLTYSWDTSNKALGDHILNVSHNFADDDNSNDSKSTTVTVNDEPVAGTMYVESISFSGKKAGRNLFLYTTVEVFDNNNPLVGVMVEMTLTGPGGSWNFTGNTLEDGTVMFTLKTKQTGIYTAKVTNIPDGETENSCTLNSDGTINLAGSVASNSLDKPMRNYPNPFNPETKIEYGIKETGFVSIKIYNVMGQVVRTLVNGAQSAGFYTVVWNGRDEQGRELSSGIYYCRLVAGKQSAILNMLLLK